MIFLVCVETPFYFTTLFFSPNEFSGKPESTTAAKPAAWGGMKIITITGFKSGVGKSTTAVSWSNRSIADSTIYVVGRTS